MTVNHSTRVCGPVFPSLPLYRVLGSSVPEEGGSQELRAVNGRNAPRMTQDTPCEVLSVYVRIRGIGRALCGDTRTACSRGVKAKVGPGGEMLRGRESEHGKFWGRQEDLLGVTIESAARKFE